MAAVHTPDADATATAGARPDVEVEVPEVLFREARRRERRRRLLMLAAALLVLGGAALGYLLASGSFSPTPHRAAPSPRAGSVSTAVGGPLEHPYGLAVAASGDLYIVDSARDQVLRRLPSGRFEVVAGDGRRGFSGDGGRAIDAELNLATRSALAIATDGTLYIADSGNDRVRAVFPDGTITTVAGDGSAGGDHGLILRTTPALDASFGPPSGLALGLHGDLYIGAANVVRLTPNGLIEWVAGARGPLAACGSIYCNPASEADFLAPDQLTFDRAGDLFVGVDNGPSLYEVAANGRLSYLGQFRAGGGRAGALAEAPDGTVVAAGQLGLARLPANGRIATPKGQPQVVLALGEPIPGNLDHALGANKHLLGGYNVFIAGEGVAAGPGGTVYADTNTGNTFTAVSALVEVKPGGTVLTLWRS